MSIFVQMRHATALDWFLLTAFWVLVLGLPVTKYLEVRREPLPKDSKEAAARTQWSARQWGHYALSRRLDDSSYWVFIGAALASGGILRARRQMPLEPPAPKRARAIAIVIAMVVAIAFVGSYILIMKQTKGTFFWEVRADDNRIWTDVQKKDVQTLQNIEAAIFVALILSIGFVTGLGASTALQGKSIMRCSRQVGAMPAPLTEAITLLAKSCLTPFVAFTLFFFAYQLLIETLAAGGPHSPDELWVAVEAIIFFSLPFVALYIFCRVLWRRYFSIAIEPPTVVEVTCKEIERASDPHERIPPPISIK